MTARPEDPHIGLVVEGPGDRAALPLLLRSYVLSKGEYRDVLGKPVTLNGRDKAFRANGIEGYVAAAGSRPGCLAVLVVLDGEGNCVAADGSELLGRSEPIVSIPVAVALADKDFEDWLYASSETLDLGLSFEPGKRGQREIQRALRPGSYTKPVWQPRLAARVDLDIAAPRSPSLMRMLARFDGLLHLLPPLDLN